MNEERCWCGDPDCDGARLDDWDPDTDDPDEPTIVESGPIKLKQTKESNDTAMDGN